MIKENSIQYSNLSTIYTMTLPFPTILSYHSVTLAVCTLQLDILCDSIFHIHEWFIDRTEIKNNAWGCQYANDKMSTSPPPRDKHQLVYIICCWLGIGMLLQWNFFSQDLNKMFSFKFISNICGVSRGAPSGLRHCHFFPFFRFQTSLLSLFHFYHLPLDMVSAKSK